MTRPVVCLPLLVLLAAILALPARGTAAQEDPAVLARVVPAAVQIAVVSMVTTNGETNPSVLPVASGTVITPDGLILTNAHVVDMNMYRSMARSAEQQAQARGERLSIVLDEENFLVLQWSDTGPPEPVFLAQVVTHDTELDLAVLRIVGDAAGQPLTTARTLPFVPLGDSNTLRLGEPIAILGYPMVGGNSITYTSGVVSGFNYDGDSRERAWITTDATLSGGSSGGTAINHRGELIGVPTQGSELDCRPGDTNWDGDITVADVGCIPVGGSIGQLRPINMAQQLLTGVDYPAHLDTPDEGLAKWPQMPKEETAPTP